MLPVANQTLSNLSAGGRFNHNIVGWYASKIWLFFEIENWRFRLNPSYAWSLRTLHPLKCWILWRTRWTSSTNCFVYTALNIVGEMARIWDSMEMLKIILIIRGREWWIAIDLWRVDIMESSPALFGCFDQDYDGCVHSADVKKNVEIVLQCTFLVVIVFPAIAHFQQTCQNYPNQTKKRFISIFIFGQGKSVPSPPSIFSKKISGENIDLDSQRVTSRLERLSSWKWYFREIVCPSSHHILKVDTWVKLTASFGTRVQFNISAAAPRLSKEMAGTFTLSEFCRTN